MWNSVGVGVGVSAATYPLADFLRNGFKDLVMSPAIEPIAQCLGGAPQDVFEGSFVGTQGACGRFCFVQCEHVGWAREGIVDCWNQELDFLRVPFPDVMPGDFPLHLSPLRDL